MLNVEIDGKDYKVPTEWADITLSQYSSAFSFLETPDENADAKARYRKLRENESVVISRLLGENDNFCLNLPLTTYNTLTNMMSFVYDRPKADAKATLTIDGKEYKSIDLNECSLRRWLDIENRIEAKSKDFFCELLAICLTPEPYGDVDDLFYNKVRNTTCDKALPLLAFFFDSATLSQRASQLLSGAQAIVEAFAQNLRISTKPTSGTTSSTSSQEENILT